MFLKGRSRKKFENPCLKYFKYKIFLHWKRIYFELLGSNDITKKFKYQIERIWIHYKSAITIFPGIIFPAITLCNLKGNQVKGFWLDPVTKTLQLSYKTATMENSWRLPKKLIHNIQEPQDSLFLKILLCHIHVLSTKSFYQFFWLYLTVSCRPTCT